MKIGNRLAVVCITCLAALVAPKSADAQNLSHGTHQSISDGVLNLSAWMGGSNAVISDYSVTVDTNFNPSEQQFYITASVSMSGRWADPNVVTPNMQYLIDNGLESRNTFSYTVFSNDGIDYMLDTPVSVTVTSKYYLERYFDDYYNDWRVWGSGSGNFTGNGVVPVNSSSSISIFDDQVAGGLISHWHFDGYVRYRVTENMTPIPAPGAAALLGLGSLVAIWRRR